MRTKENEVIYRVCKNLFEAIRKNSKRSYYSKLFAKYKNDIKITWKIINEMIINTKNKRRDLPGKLVINNTTVVEKEENLLKILIGTLQTLAPISHLKYLTNQEVLKSI